MFHVTDWWLLGRCGSNRRQAGSHCYGDVVLVNVNTLDVILYSSSARCFHHGTQLKGTKLFYNHK